MGPSRSSRSATRRTSSPTRPRGSTSCSSGSRGYGPMHAVMVGGVSGQLVREAACPVIVFPRSAGDAEDASLFAKTAAVHG